MNLPPIYEHSALVHDDSMWIFGGMWIDSGTYSNDIYQFNFQTEILNKITTNTSRINPIERSTHSAVIYDNKMFILNGFSKKNQKNVIYKYKKTYSFYKGDNSRFYFL